MTVALGRWAERAACIRYPADWWHSDDRADREKAAEVCAACPVRAECLACAQRWYDNSEPTQPHGTWGGVLWLVPKPKLPSDGPRPAPIERSSECGRVVAYRRHLANGERPCHRCLLAMIKELRRQEKRKAGVRAK